MISGDRLKKILETLPGDVQCSVNGECIDISLPDTEERWCVTALDGEEEDYQDDFRHLFSGKEVEKERAEFMAHLKRCSDEVKTWPKRKKEGFKLILEKERTL